MARRTKKKVSPTVSARSKKRRVKNAGKRSITSKALYDIFMDKDPIAFDMGRRFSSILTDPSTLQGHGTIQLEKKPSGLWAKSEKGGSILLLPTDTRLDDVTSQGIVTRRSDYFYYPTEDNLSIVASTAWPPSPEEAIHVLEQWQPVDVDDPTPDPILMILPTYARSKDRSDTYSRTETESIAHEHSREDLIPEWGVEDWTPEQAKEAQEAIADATGYEFGEHDPTFVVPVTEEGWQMLDEIYKEGVAPKRSSNPQTLHVTPRRKKIAAQIDRQLADLPQNATLTDRQVKQILAALAS
jgi:hypothetical protein